MTVAQELRQMAKRLVAAADALEGCTMAQTQVPRPQPQQQKQPVPQRGVIKDPDAPATDAQYRKMFAIWHDAFREDPTPKPQKGMTKGQASEWIDKHQRG